MSPKMRTAHTAKVRADGTRVLAFALVTALLGTVITFTLGNTTVGSKDSFHARFTNVSGLTSGTDVRAAGVSVGTVEGLKLVANNEITVTFSVAKSVGLQTTTLARVRYANLTGDRYLELSQAPGKTGPSDGSALPPGSTIPTSRTTPALDLDLLFNGFRPLMRAMDPRQVNQLTASLIAVSQGQGEATAKLLTQVASFTSTLADNDKVVGGVIDNLSAVLGVVNDNRDNVGNLIDGLQKLMTGLAKDRKVIGTSVEHLGVLTNDTASLLKQVRPDLKQDLTQLTRMAHAINVESAQAQKYIALLPKAIQAMGRGGAYGSFFNFFICGLRFRYTGPNAQPTYTDFFMSKESRCQF